MLELLLLDKADATRDTGKTREHIAEELAVDVVGMEYDTLLRRLGQQYDGLAHLIDGRELHTFVTHSVRTATEHVVDADATHERVGGEISLELTIGRAGGKVTHTHDLRIETVEGDSIEDEPLGHELRIDVLVAEILTHIETLLSKYLVLDFAYPETAGAGSGDMDELGSRLDTKVNTPLGSSDIDVLNLGTF